MENNTTQPITPINPVSHQKEYWLVIICLIAISALMLIANKWMNLSERNQLLYLSAYLIMYVGQLVYLTLCRGRDNILEQQHLQWQIMIWKENEEKTKATLQKADTIMRRESEQRQQDTNLYLKFLETSKGDMNELDKLLSNYNTYLRNLKS